MSTRPIETCCDCGSPTGRAGRADDSLYTPDSRGPYCETCWYGGALDRALTANETLRADSAKLASVLSVISEHKLAELHGKASAAPWFKGWEHETMCELYTGSIEGRNRHIATFHGGMLKPDVPHSLNVDLVEALRNALPLLLAALGELKSGEKEEVSDAR